uniref:Fringe-like glycosyltransferase domain-containing protein n=1 Tax=Strigamia maritima TaxID=126957 RepID=T1J2N0_STRMM
VFIVISQANTFHELHVNGIKNSLISQAAELNLKNLTIYLTHEEWSHLPGSWTIFPILDNLLEKHRENADWVFISEEFTHIHLQYLLKYLNGFNSSLDWFLGRALYDKEPTIIHHFSFHENPQIFLYPDFATGVAISFPLLSKINEKWKSDPIHSDFSIDPKHELALFLYDSLNVKLVHAPNLCLEKVYKDCITSYATKIPKCGPPVPNDEIYFAVKTCGKFHETRIPIIKQTWGKHATHIGYFSDKFESSIPTKDMNIPNTEKGHCEKTFAIIDHVVSHPEFQRKSWLVIADDDTLMSIYKLRQTLSCYDPSDFIALGERYGYGVTDERGYNYITGGGGIVLSMSLARHIIESEMCICPSIDTPDDMFLGICLKKLEVPIVHSPLFHQARPMDYADGYLMHQEPISFHKHWMVDPFKIYKEWFAEDDEREPAHYRHLEL